MEETTSTENITVVCECEHIDYTEQLETITLQLDSISSNLYDTTLLIKNGFMIALVVFLMIIIYKFFRLFF